MTFPKILSFGCGEEVNRLASSGAALVPYAPGKGPGNFVSAGDTTTVVGGDGGGFFKGMGQGAGIGVGLLAFGTLYSFIRRRG